DRRWPSNGAWSFCRRPDHRAPPVGEIRSKALQYQSDVSFDHPENILLIKYGLPLGNGGVHVVVPIEPKPHLRSHRAFLYQPRYGVAYRVGEAEVFGLLFGCLLRANC